MVGALGVLLLPAHNPANLVTMSPNTALVADAYERRYRAFFNGAKRGP